MSPAKRPTPNARSGGANGTGARDKALRAKAPPEDALRDYRAKTAHEASRLSRRVKESGHPAPLGDPSSGVLLVVEGPVGPRALQALTLSLAAVGLPNAYVTYSPTGLLGEEILAVQPRALAAVGPGAAREIDGLDHPLAREAFSRAQEGVWFAWTRSTAGLLLPPLTPALDNDAAKKRFWLAFKSLRTLSASP